MSREVNPGNMLCQRCNHKADDHRLDDSTNVAPTDPAAQFRCVISPVWNRQPTCDCPNFDPPPEFVSYFENLS